MLNFTSEPTRSSNTFNQFSATFRRIFNPFLINGRKSKTKDLDKVSAEWKALQWRVFFGLKSVHMVHTFPNRISRITKQIKILKDFEFFQFIIVFLNFFLSLEQNPSSHAKSSKLIEECKNSKVYPTLDHPIEILNLNNQLKECPICLLTLPKNTKELDCGHSSCDACLIKYLKTEISESRVSITCPECSELLHPNRIQELLVNDAHYLRKYEEFIIRKVLITDPDTR